ncbi:taste receptor type 2 member 134-like [Sminthopsis crassicaudata]|uniref:taste receptor type 2 member 134-like n=1 Tax=Sminthopsis crassicaudata TaxID=9301 RepID=UPI003D697875
MPSLLIVFFMIFFLLESVVAIIGNGFIIIVLGREWMRCWTLTPGDMILASLGISRFFLQWTAIISNFYSYFFSNEKGVLFGMVWNLPNVTTFCFTTLLAVFYCVKLSSFNHSIFFWLKWRISRFVPWLLLWSIVLSILISVLSLVKGYHALQPPVIGNYSEKTILSANIRSFQINFFLPLQLFVLLIPFSVFLASIILLISSLCQHLGNMEHHSADPQDPKMQVHIITLKSLFFFLILFTSYLLPLIITTTTPISVCSSWFWIREVVTYAGISIHPAFLILNTSKLRRALKKMLHGPESA